MNARQRRQAEMIARVREVASEPESEDGWGRVTASLAGAKVHSMAFKVSVSADGEESLWMFPRCGTIRSAHGTGAHYVNYYANLGAEVTCAKCAD